MEGCFELPAYSTLDEMAARIRGEVNSEIFAGITARVGPAGMLRLDGLLVAAKASGKSEFNRLKKTAQRPSWTYFRVLLDQLRWVDSLGDSPMWLEGVAASKIADFAGEAEVAYADVLGATREGNGSRCWRRWCSRRGPKPATTSRKCFADGWPR